MIFYILKATIYLFLNAYINVPDLLAISFLKVVYKVEFDLFYFEI